MATTIYNRIKIKIGLIADFISAQYAGLVGIVSNIPTIGSAFGWFDGTVWKYSTPMNASGESLPNAVKIGSVLALDSSNNHTANSYSVNGNTVIDSSLNANFGVVRTGAADRINSLGAGFFTAISVSGLTNGKLPRVSSGSGLLGDSALSDNGVIVTSTRPLSVQGEILSWYHIFNYGAGNDTPLGSGRSVGTFTTSDISAYYGGFMQLSAANHLDFYVGNGAAWNRQFRLATDGTHSLMGSLSMSGGCGFFGVTAPTTRPTVNAAATDLATSIALLNQIRTHLIACGLVQ